MVFNVPRLGPDGGYVHKDTGSREDATEYAVRLGVRNTDSSRRCKSQTD